MLNHKHTQTFEFIKGHASSNGYAPTIREIGRYIGFRSASGVHSILKKLEGEGLIRRSREWRGIEVVEQGKVK